MGPRRRKPPVEGSLDDLLDRFDPVNEAVRMVADALPEPQFNSAYDDDYDDFDFDGDIGGDDE